MVSAEHRGNKGKIKVGKKTSWQLVTFWIQRRRNLSRLQLLSWPRKRWLNLKLPILIFMKSEHFTSVKNKLTRLLSLLQGLTLIFQRMLRNLVMGPLWAMNQSEAFQTVFKMLKKLNLKLPIFNEKQTFHVSWKQTNMRFKPFTRFDINFLENA